MPNGEERVTRELLAGEALHILKSLKENKSAGRSNKLADVKQALEPSVSLEFDNYFFFLRKFNFIAMDREACLQTTADGDKVIDGPLRERFGEAVGEYFASRLGDDSPPEPTQRRAVPPPPPAAVAPPPPPAPEPVKLTEQVRPEVLAEAEPEHEEPPAAPPPPVRPAKSKRPPPVIPASGASVPVAPPDPEPPAPPPPVRAAPEPSRPASAESIRHVAEEKPMVAASRPAAPSPASNADLDGRYLRGDPLGSGPLGSVFRARFVPTGVDVAVKELKDIFGFFSFLQRNEVLKRLRKELSGQAQVRHPSIVQVLDLNLDTARPYYVLEMCAGGSLRAEMEEVEGKGLKVEQAIRYFLQLCYGLRAAHAAGLTHQNIKPENVLIDHLGNAKLTDFGLTRVIEVDAVKGMPQVIVGTGGMGYLPPELLGRNRGATDSADVYSLGILFYEMLTGALPGRRSPLPSQVRKDVPDKLDAIFDRMTQDRMADRLPDVDAVLTEFYSAFSGGDWLRKGDLVLWSESAAAGSKGPSASEPASES